MRVSFSRTIDGAWAQAERLRLGAPAPDGAPADIHVLVEGDGGARLVVDVIAPPAQAYPFSDIQAWQGLVVIGYGSALYIVRVRERTGAMVPMDGYFGSLLVNDGVCLACSSSEMLRVGPDGSILWRTGGLAADGVIINDVQDGVIKASGQWDPPDAPWTDVRLSLETGSRLG